MLKRISYISGIAAALFLSACGNRQESAKDQDTLSKGTISISVDETYRPVIEEQIKVFANEYPEARLNTGYKPETSCIEDLLNERSVMALVTRELNAAELKICRDRKLVPSSMAIARDGVAVIVHPSSSDTGYTVAQLREILSGKGTQQYTVVFDNSGSSTVRLVQDSILNGMPLRKDIFAARSNDAVIKYVAENPGAIGFVGLPHLAAVRNPEDMSFPANIRVVSLKSETEQAYYQPLQAYVARQAYPLSRNLYYIYTQTHVGLARGFGNFLADNRGQLIFKQAGLFPLRKDIVIKEAVLNGEQ